MNWFGPGAGDCGCCMEVDPCGCNGSAAGSYAVTLQNWLDNGCCEACDEFAGTHVLSQLYECQWLKEGSSAAPCPCGDPPAYDDHYAIRLIFEDVSGNLRVTVVIAYCCNPRPGGGGELCNTFIYYRKTFTGHPNCRAFADEPIPYWQKTTSPPAVCDYGVTIDDLLLSAV